MEGDSDPQLPDSRVCTPNTFQSLGSTLHQASRQRESQQSPQTSYSYSHINSFIKYKFLSTCGDWIFRRKTCCLVQWLLGYPCSLLVQPSLPMKPNIYYKNKMSTKGKDRQNNLKQGRFQVSEARLNWGFFSPVAPGLHPHCSLHVQGHIHTAILQHAAPGQETWLGTPTVWGTIQTWGSHHHIRNLYPTMGFSNPQPTGHWWYLSSRDHISTWLLGLSRHAISNFAEF